MLTPALAGQEIDLLTFCASFRKSRWRAWLNQARHRLGDADEYPAAIPFLLLCVGHTMKLVDAGAGQKHAALFRHVAGGYLVPARLDR